MKNRTVTIEIDHSLAGFFDELSALFGTRENAITAFVVSHPDFQSWAPKVHFCPTCGKWIPIVDSKSPHFPLELEEHQRSIKGELGFWLARCPGSGRGRRPHRPPELDASPKMTQARIGHHIKHHVQPGFI